MNLPTAIMLLMCCFGMLISVSSFSVAFPSSANVPRASSSPLSFSMELPISSSVQLAAVVSKRSTIASSTRRSTTTYATRKISTRLFMSSTDKDVSRTTKKGTEVIDKTETQVEEKKNEEKEWRVVLHNDEVHTFNYVVRSLTKVIGTLDRKAAFEICVQTHGIGKATVTKTWKKQAEQFCLGLQRQGLTVSISPDEDFEGGHSGGGI